VVSAVPIAIRLPSASNAMAFDFISTPAPVADLDWGTDGILVRMGNGDLERHLPIRCA
jgi:hypothetical protein